MREHNHWKDTFKSNVTHDNAAINQLAEIQTWKSNKFSTPTKQNKSKKTYEYTSDSAALSRPSISHDSK